MTDIKELRRLAEADDYVTPAHQWPNEGIWKALDFSADSAKFLSSVSPSAILSLLDKIDELEEKYSALSEKYLDAACKYSALMDRHLNERENVGVKP